MVVKVKEKFEKKLDMLKIMIKVKSTLYVEKEMQDIIIKFCLRERNLISFLKRTI